MIDDRIERGEPVAHAAGGSGEVDDERSRANAGEAARQRRAREARHRQHANPLGDPRRLALDHGARGFGRDVARGEAGAAGGEHEIGGVAIAPGDELRDDGGDVVGDEGARYYNVAAGGDAAGDSSDLARLVAHAAIASPEPSVVRSPRAPASLIVSIAIRIRQYAEFAERLPSRRLKRS